MRYCASRPETPERVVASFMSTGRKVHTEGVLTEFTAVTDVVLSKVCEVGRGLYCIVSRSTEQGDENSAFFPILTINLRIWPRMPMAPHKRLACPDH